MKRGEVDRSWYNRAGVERVMGLTWKLAPMDLKLVPEKY